MQLIPAGLALAVLVAAVAARDEGADPEVFTANMSGAAERPTPVASSATGVATFTVRQDTVTFSISVNGLSGVATMVHIHAPADTGQAGPPVHNFTITGAAAGTIVSGMFFRPSSGAIRQDSLLTLMRNGRAYVNVHTVANPNGEIRGQIRLE